MMKVKWNEKVKEVSKGIRMFDNSIVGKALEMIPSAAFFVNKNNMIVHSNKIFNRAFGNGVGKEYQRFLIDRNPLKAENGQKIFAKNGHIFNLDLILYKEDTDENLWLGILKDVTELHKLKDYIKYLENLNKDISDLYHDQKKIIERLTQQALTDGLTGLYNHRHFWEQVNVELKRANRYSETLSCLMIDIDDFKQVNDHFDHQFGDAVLKKIAKLLKTPLRATDLLARYGGDEFAVLLPNTDYQGSQVISNKILERVRSSIFDIKGYSANVTISLGISSYPTDNISNPSQLVEYADAALYDAKKKGKDRISFFHDLGSFSIH